MTRSRIIVVAAAALGLAACAQEPQPAEAVSENQVPPPADHDGAPALPDRIVAERGGFIPEGVEYDRANGRFLTGSLAEGTVFEIRTDGRVVPFIIDPDLVSSVGIEVDESRGRLLVCNSARGDAGAQAKLGIYDLDTGERIAMVDLTSALHNPPEDAAFLANDVAVDDDGNAYVTDTRQNVIYKVGANHVPTILYRFDPVDGLALNGIVYDSDGYLIVVGGPRLYKVTIGDPAQMIEVSLPEPIGGADGMVFLPDRRLAVMSYSQDRVVALTSDDDWASAKIAATASFKGQATTAAVANGNVYVVHPHFNDDEPPSIERVTFQ